MQNQESNNVYISNIPQGHAQYIEQDSDDSDAKQSSYQRNIRKNIKKVQPKVQQQTLTYAQKIRELYKKGSFRDLVNLTEKDKTSFQEYDEIKVNNHKVRIDQNAIIKNAEIPSEDYVAKIQRIMTINEPKTQKLICLCEVKWYYRKSEIVKQRPQAKSWISVNEVFTTQSCDVILASAIQQPCIILSLEEYERLNPVDKGVFFTRMGWIPSKNKFDGYNKAVLHCTCKLPLNPDLPYIQCDKCEEWYHMICVGVKKGEYDQKEYICGCCR